MLKNEIEILIVDDDKTFGKACLEAVRRAGYKGTLSHSPDEALQAAKIQTFQALVIDCMLPKMPGIELAQEIKKLQHSEIPIILMSGIYRDRNFIQKATKSAQAYTFLSKPFDLEQITKNLDTVLDELIETPKDPLPRLFANKNATARQVLEAIDESDNLHGFELPFIYALFIQSRLSGQMNIIEAQGEIFGISFKDGKIVSVETTDTPSQVGELLTEKGYLTPVEVKSALAKQGGSLIGEYLVQNNIVSPHAIDEVLVEQMEIRLGNTIFDTSVEINFMKSSSIKDSYGINMDHFAPLLDHWFSNKVSESWLESYYLPWLDNKVKIDSKKMAGHPIFNTRFFHKHTDFLNDFSQAGTIQSLLDTEKYPSNKVYKGAHLLAITRCLGFGVKVKSVDYNLLQQRLNKMEADLKGKNYFEMLNISKNARVNEIRRAYHELAKLLHPDRLPADVPADVKEINDTVFRMINEAHNTLKEEQSRHRYLQELEEGHAKELLKVESMIEKGKHLLKTGKFQQSLEQFNNAYAIQKDNFELNAYRIWARLKIIDPQNQRDEFQSLDREILELAQYDRRNELFHFVKGLYQFQVGKLDLAKNHLENAVALNPNFLEARRELNVIKLKQSGSSKPVDILRGDLKDVVGMLFKKK